MPEAELDAGTAQPFSHRGLNLRAWLELRWEALEQRVGRADPRLRPSFLLPLDGLRTWAQPLVSISAGLRFGTRGQSRLADPRGSEKTKDLRRRLRPEWHLRIWRQHQVGGLGGRDSASQRAQGY